MPFSDGCRAFVRNFASFVCSPSTKQVSLHAVRPSAALWFAEMVSKPVPASSNRCVALVAAALVLFC